MGKNELDQTERKLLGRLHRLEGQVRSIERLLSKNDRDQTVVQLEAIVAAAKSCLTAYATMIIDDEAVSLAEKQRLLIRLAAKLG